LIINRAFYREVIQSTLAVVSVLLILFVFLSLTKLLGKAAAGEYPNDIILNLLALQVLLKLDILLPLSLYIGIIFTLGRWYRDSEMAVLAACGVGVLGLLRPAMILATIVSVFIAFLAFYLTPILASAVDRIKQDSNKQQQVSGISPGIFSESGDGKSIYYVERVNVKQKRFETIFVRSQEGGRNSIMSAKSGYRYTDSKTGDKFLVLENGELHEGEPGSARYKRLTFASYAIRIEPRPSFFKTSRAEGLPTRRLLGSNDSSLVAELHWRIAKPLSIFILAMFAIVMSYTDMRRGRFANLFMAILLYFIYSNMLGLGQTLLKQGKLPLAFGMWWIHLLMAAVAVYFLILRNQNKSLLSLPYFRRRH